MASSDDSHSAVGNPYQSPAADADTMSDAGGDAGTLNDTRNGQGLYRLRLVTLILGCIWLGLGLCAGATSGIIASEIRRDPSLTTVVVAMAGIGVLCLLLGIAICLQQLWAVYLGMGLAYLALLGNLLYVNICPFLIASLAVVMVSHIAIWKAKRVRRDDIRLRAKIQTLT